MQVIIPKHVFGLRRAIRVLEYMTMDSIWKNLREPGLCCERVKLYLPKFKITSDLNFVKSFKEVSSDILFYGNCRNVKKLMRIAL